MMTFRMGDLPLNVQEMKPAFSITEAKADGNIQIPIGVSLKEVEKEVILATLNHCGWHRQKTAEVLQISERNLRDKIKLYDIKQMNNFNKSAFFADYIG